MKIALVEDDASFASIVMEWLREADHEPEWFRTGREYFRAMADKKYDVCLLDWVLPDISGPEVMLGMKLKGSMPPVIFLTARDAEEDIVSVIQSGADDYIVKPPSKALLIARLHAVARRYTTSIQQDAIQDFGHIVVDFGNRQFLVKGVPARLTEKETELALYFFSRIGQLLPREHLIQVVWGSNPALDTRTVDVHVSHLRNKLGLSPEHGWRLTSVYRQGYRLERIREPV